MTIEVLSHIPLQKGIFFVYNEYNKQRDLMNKTQTIINRILQVENFQNVACVCANWEEFVQELVDRINATNLYRVVKQVEKVTFK